MIRFTVIAAAYVECCDPQALLGNGAPMDRVEAIIEQFRQLPPAPAVKPTVRRRGWWFLLAIVPIMIVMTVAGRNPETSETDWRAEMHRIDTTRMRAFMERKPELLSSILVVGSPAYAHDLEVIRDMEVRHIVLDRDPFEVIAVALRRASVVNGVERAQLEVVDRLTAHAFVSGATKILQGGQRGERTWRLELRRRGDGPWRLYSATAITSKSSIPTSDQGN